MTSKLIVVSNRLPITLSNSEDAGWSFSMSSGGLVSALSGLKKDTVFTWLGRLKQTNQRLARTSDSRKRAKDCAKTTHGSVFMHAGFFT